MYVVLTGIFLLVNVFGEINGSTYTGLDDNAILIADTTLYCITENNQNTNNPQVKWSHVDLAGVRTDLNSIVDTTTGVSTMQVYTTKPGYYSCEVIQDRTSKRTYTAVMTDTNPNTGMYRKMELLGEGFHLNFRV